MSKNEEIMYNLSDSSLSAVYEYLLTFIYSMAHFFGYAVVRVIDQILPNVNFGSDLIDPIGYLVILTLFLFLVQVAKKIAWVVVIVGWVLILIRLILAIFGY